MGKAEENKLKKHEALLNAAYELFITNGLNNTSISEITEKAGVAKGTFYLYFKDKYDINTKLIISRTSQMVDNAIMKLSETDIDGFKDKLIFVIDYVIGSLAENKTLLNFITKNLGLGFYPSSVKTIDVSRDPQIQAAFQALLADAGDSIKEPEIMLYLIIELVGSCIYYSIIYGRPVPIEDLKPHLYETISRIVDQFTNE